MSAILKKAMVYKKQQQQQKTKPKIFEYVIIIGY